MKNFYWRFDGTGISNSKKVGFLKYLVKGSVKNNLVEFAPKFAVDLINLIE